jgi:hypothetical protein
VTDLLPLILVGAGYTGLLGSLLGRMIAIGRRVQKRLLNIAREDLHFENPQSPTFAKHNTIRGTWNGKDVSIAIHRQAGAGTRGAIVEMTLNTDLTDRVYIRNRATMELYPPIRAIMFRKFPQVSLSNPSDQSAFRVQGNADTIEKLLASPASRRLLVKNLIDADSELVLNHGKLRIFRYTRMRMHDNDPIIEEKLREILIQQWDLLRTVLAVIEPSSLQVEERQALALHCPYCKGELTDNYDLLRCSECATLHHESCWRENGHCSVFGCAGFPTPFVKERGNQAMRNIE